MRISDWSSDVCSSDLGAVVPLEHAIVALIEAPGTLDRRGRTANLLEDDVEGLRGAAEVGGAGQLEAVARRRQHAARALGFLPARGAPGRIGPETGRAACRVRVCQYG